MFIYTSTKIRPPQIIDYMIKCVLLPILQRKKTIRDACVCFFLKCKISTHTRREGREILSNCHLRTCWGLTHLNAVGQVGRLEIPAEWGFTVLGLKTVWKKSSFFLGKNSFRFPWENCFCLKSLTDWLKHTQIMESNLLYQSLLSFY